MPTITPTQAICDFASRRISDHELYRALLAHDDWRVPGSGNPIVPTIFVHDARGIPVHWLFSTAAAYDAGCAKLNAAAIGPQVRVAHLDDVMRAIDPRVQVLTIDPFSPISLRIQTDEIFAFSELARAVRVERAILERDFAAIRAFDRYAVPYFGVLGQGHNLVTMPCEGRTMLAAFTAPDAVEAFVASGSEADRARVKFVTVDGDQLFGVVHEVADGVLMNAKGPRTFGFTIDDCRGIASTPA